MATGKAKKARRLLHKAALDNGLMLLTCGSYDNIIRWIPPLVVNEAQVKEALRMFENALG